MTETIIAQAIKDCLDPTKPEHRQVLRYVGQILRVAHNRGQPMCYLGSVADEVCTVIDEYESSSRPMGGGLDDDDDIPFELRTVQTNFGCTWYVPRLTKAIGRAPDGRPFLTCEGKSENDRNGSRLRFARSLACRVKGRQAGETWKIKAPEGCTFIGWTSDNFPIVEWPDAVEGDIRMSMVPQCSKVVADQVRHWASRDQKRTAAKCFGMGIQFHAMSPGSGREWKITAPPHSIFWGWKKESSLAEYWPVIETRRGGDVKKIVCQSDDRYKIAQEAFLESSRPQWGEFRQTSIQWEDWRGKPVSGKFNEHQKEDAKMAHLQEYELHDWARRQPAPKPPMRKVELKTAAYERAWVEDNVAFIPHLTDPTKMWVVKAPAGSKLVFVNGGTPMGKRNLPNGDVLIENNFVTKHYLGGILHADDPIDLSVSVPEGLNLEHEVNSALDNLYRARERMAGMNRVSSGTLYDEVAKTPEPPQGEWSHMKALFESGLLIDKSKPTPGDIITESVDIPILAVGDVAPGGPVRIMRDGKLSTWRPQKGQVYMGCLINNEPMFTTGTTSEKSPD